MTWPNTTVSTTHLDAGTDEPRLARADLKDAVDKLNSIINTGINGEYVVVAFTGVVTRPDTHIPGNYTWYPHMQTVYASGNSFVRFRANVRSNVAVTSGPYFVLPEGRYEFNVLSQERAYYFSNLATWFTPSTTSMTFERRPSVFPDDINPTVIIPTMQRNGFEFHTQPTPGDAGVNENLIASPWIPNQLVVTANVIVAQANGGGWSGESLGTADGVGIQGSPRFQFFKIRKLTNNP